MVVVMVIYLLTALGKISSQLVFPKAVIPANVSISYPSMGKAYMCTPI